MPDITLPLWGYIVSLLVAGVVPIIVDELRGRRMKHRAATHRGAQDVLRRVERLRNGRWLKSARVRTEFDKYADEAIEVANGGES